MKRILLPILAGLMLTACSHNESLIQGTVTGLPDGTVYLLRRDIEMSKIDSVQVQNGAFTFKRETAKPEELYLQFAGQKGFFPIIFEADTVQVNASFDAAPLVKASGTETNDLLAQYRQSEEVFVKQQGDISDQVADLTPADSIVRDSLIAAYYKLEDQKGDLQSNFITQHKGKVVSAYLLSKQNTYGYIPVQVDSLIALAGPVPANVFLDKMQARRATLENVGPGKPAPDFTMTTVDGTPFTFSSLKGQVVMIDFWASWCGPCRRENPNVVKLYNKYKDHGFTIVGVSLDESREDWVAAIAKDKLTWTHVSDLKGWDCPPAREYGVVAIPHTTLVDKDGIILGQVVFGEELEALIVKSLGLEDAEI